MKSTMLIFLVLMLVFLSSCEFLGYDEEIAKIVKSGSPEDCAKLEAEDSSASQDRIEKCYDSYAQAHKQPELCSKIQKESRHDYCFEELAEELENLELCEQLKGNKDSCISKVGIAKNDESICEQLSKGSAKDDCNSQIAINKESVAICELVDSDMARDFCMMRLALQKQDIAICEKVSRYSKDRCIADIAITMKDESLCEKASKKETCAEAVQTATNKEKEEITSKPGIVEYEGRLYINSPPGEVLRITPEDLPNWASLIMVTVGATATCTGPPSTIVTGDENVLLNGLPVARINDETSHGGKITEGSDLIYINGVRAAIIGSNTVCPMVTGTVPHVGGPITSNGYK